MKEKKTNAIKLHVIINIDDLEGHVTRISVVGDSERYRYTISCYLVTTITGCNNSSAKLNPRVLKVASRG